MFGLTKEEGKEKDGEGIWKINGAKRDGIVRETGGRAHNTHTGC